jgi:hypothetical protein
LPQDPAKSAPLDLPMQRHHATDRPAAHHHVAPPLTHSREPEALQRTNGLSP